MSLLSALDAAVSGLNAVNTAVNTTSQNVANANNEDYNAQEAIFTDVQNGGVQISAIRRLTNTALRDELLNEITAAASSVKRDETYRLIEQLTGTIAGETPLVDTIEEFETAWKAYEAAPESNAARTDVVLQGQAIVAEIERISSGLDIIERQTREELVAAIGDINNAMAEIERLNATIVREAAAGRPIADLENLRDAEIIDLAQYFDLTVLNRSDGQVAVYTTSGLDLVDSVASVFTFNDGTFELTKTGSGSTDLLPSLPDGLLRALTNTLATDATSIQSTSNGVAVFQKLRNQLDELAFSFVDVSVASATGTQIVNSGTDITTFTGVDAGDVITVNVGGSNQSATVTAGMTAAALVAALDALTNVDARIDATGQIQILSNAGDLTITDPGGAAAGLGLVTASPQTFSQATAVTFARAYQAEVGTGGAALASTTVLTDPPLSIPNASTFTVSVGGAAASTITINTGDTAADVVTALNDLEGVRARIDANGFLEISSIAGSLVITDGANTPLATLGFTTNAGVVTVEGSTLTGEAARFFEAEAGTTPTDVSRVNFRVNDTLVSNAETVKKLVASPVIEALTENTRSISGSGISLTREDYTSLASGILVEVTRQATISSRSAERAVTLRDSLTEALRNEVGVNLDEELARLTVLQTSYAASARVLSTVDELLGILEGIVR
ncbi:MAG: flagellar basal body rod C-terminal domain-containing protein [Alphaproteobacteria bacterium]|nr:flagellar basal body rod C-terminal domain-containing protein [Alphaproteobacteria bacterium]